MLDKLFDINKSYEETEEDLIGKVMHERLQGLQIELCTLKKKKNK